jgi:DNA polymerase-3 subunit gamma/tau
MTLLRMLAFRPTTAGKETEPPPPPANRRAATTQGAPAPMPAKVTLPARAPAPTEAKAAAPAVEPLRTPAPVSAPPAVSPQESEWAQTVERLPVNGLLRELLNNIALESINEQGISLVLDEACAKLHSKEREMALKAALEQHYGRPMQLAMRVGAPPVPTPAQRKTWLQNEQQQAAVQAVNSDPNVQALREKFNARVNPESIRPPVTRSEPG